MYQFKLPTKKRSINSSMKAKNMKKSVEESGADAIVGEATELAFFETEPVELLCAVITGNGLDGETEGNIDGRNVKAL